MGVCHIAEIDSLIDQRNIVPPTNLKEVKVEEQKVFDFERIEFAELSLDELKRLIDVLLLNNSFKYLTMQDVVNTSSDQRIEAKRENPFQMMCRI